MKSPQFSRSLAVACLLVAPLSTFAVTQTWDGDTSVTVTTGANWVSNTPPSFTTTADVAAFDGPTTPLFQPTIPVSATVTSIGGIVTGDGYAATLTFTVGASPAPTAFAIGSFGITTGSQVATFTTSSVSNRVATLTFTDPQIWNIGTGGLAISGNTATAGGQVVATGGGQITKNGVGNVTFSPGAGTGSSGNSLLNLVINSGGFLTSNPGTRIISNAAGANATVTFNGATALLRQNSAMDASTKFTVLSGGGTFQPTNGNQNNAATGLLNGSGAFTFDTTLLPNAGSTQTTAGFNIGGSDATYSGPLTLKTGDTVTNNTQGSRIQAQNANSLGDASATNTLNIVATAANTFDSLGIANTVSLQVGTLTGNSTAIISTVAGAANVGTLVVNQAGGSTYAGTFTRGGTSGGTFNLMKNGAGILTLSGNSTATSGNGTTILSTWDKGTVTINAGALRIASNGALGTAAVPVNMISGTLSSSASGILLPNTVTTGGNDSILAPTGSFTIGALNAGLGATLTLNPGGLLTSTGLFTGSTAGSFTLDLTSGFATGSAISVINFGSKSGVDSTDFALSTAASSLYTLSNVAVTANSVDITLAAVPEPSTLAFLLGAGGCTFLAIRRRVSLEA